MNKNLINTIVRNIIFEVGKEFNVELTISIDMEFDWSLDFDFIGKGLLKRGLTVRNQSDKDGYTLSHGIHSPSETKSDLLQQIICGRVADRLFQENLKKELKKLG